MKYYLSILLAFVIQTSSFSQIPIFKEINLSFEGRVLNIHNALMDKNGILWLCSEEGLYISDGDVVSKPYGMDQPEIYITSIIETLDKNIIAGTDKGELIQFNNYFKVETRVKNPISKLPVSIIKEDSKGNLLIGTKGDGLFVLQKDKLSHYLTSDGLNDNFIYTIETFKDETILIGSDRGINFCRIANNKLTALKNLTDKDGLKDNMVTQLKILDNGMLSIGSQYYGFQIYNTNTNKFLEIDGGKEAVTTIENILDEQWIGFENGQIMDLEYTPNFLLRPLTDKTGNSFQKIQQIIYTDLNFQLVIANNRLFITSGEWHEKIKSPDRNSILKCLTYFNQKIYAVYANGIYTKMHHQDWQKFGELKSPVNLKAISSICLDQNGTMWLGSLNDGLMYVQPGGIVKRLNLDTVNMDFSIFTLTIIEDELLIGSMNGIFLVDWKTKSLHRPNDSIGRAVNSTRGKYIYTILGKNLNKLYFGTDSHGYGTIENGKVNYYTNFSNSSHKSVLTMTATDDYNSIWFSSTDIGLYKIDGSSFYPNDKKYTFNKYPILGIASDYRNNLFLVHANLLSVINPTHRQQYTLQYEIDNNESQINNNMIFQSEDFIFIGNNDGILSLQPKRFQYPENIPVTVLDKFLFLQKLDTNQAMSFAHNENHISFRCHFPWYLNPHQVRYEYYLEGSSKDTFESSESLISFPNLLPGEYRFKVRGKVEGNLLNTPWTTVAFKIRKAWYSTFWFITLVSLAVLYVFYLFVKYRIRQMNRIAEVNSSHLKQEIRVLNSQINPHFLFNSFSSLLGLIANNPKKAIEYTENLAEFYRSIVKYKDVENIPIETELSITETYIKLQNIRFNDSVKFEVTEEVRKLNKRIPPMTFQILAENAIKHNKFDANQPLKIKIELKDDHIWFSNNLSLKLTRELSTKTGLSFVKDRIYITTGKLIEIEKNDYFFIVKIPMV